MFKTEMRGSWVVVHPSGELDLAMADEFRARSSAWIGLTRWPSTSPRPALVLEEEFAVEWIIDEPNLTSGV